MGLFGSQGITRRRLAKGAAATAGAIAAITLVGCSDDDTKKTTGEPQVVNDDSKIVNVLDEYKKADTSIDPAKSWTLPLGTVLFHSEGSWAAAMTVPASSTHPNSLAALSLSSGSLDTLMDAPTTGRTYAFHDVRLASGAAAWVEMDYGAKQWVLMGQAFSGGKLDGQPVKLDHGGEDYDPPQLDATGSTIVWQKMPNVTGKKRSEDSHLYLWNAGDAEGASIYDSPGRFACAPRVSGSTLTIVPRVRESDGTYYGMTALDLSNGSRKQVDQLVLPGSVRPLEAVYLNGQFGFSIEAAYDGVGNLGKMGTFIGREGGPYVFFGREPAACVAGKGSRYLVKTQSSHYLIDTDAKTYALVAAPDRCLEFGDYPASAGETSSFLTYATIRDEQGLPANVSARLFEL